ncbi:hypothetical protein [Escherichia coli]
MMMTKHPTGIYVGCLVVHRKPPARLGVPESFQL